MSLDLTYFIILMIKHNPIHMEMGSHTPYECALNYLLADAAETDLLYKMT